jgi:ribosomal protein S18 acetylase RimI-like enzyme
MVIIRSATAVDIPAVLALWHDAGAEPSRTDDPASLGRLIEVDPSSLLVAESEGRIVGSVIAGWDGWRGSIYRLAVDPDMRRTGLGRRLVAAAEARLAEVGARRLQAIVSASQGPARQFWKSSDWNEQVQRVRFVKG